MFGIRQYGMHGWQTNITSASYTPGTIVSHVGSHTKGPWTEIISFAQFDVYGMFLQVLASAQSATRTDMALDIGIGNSGYESIVLPDWLCGWSGNATNPRGGIFIPFFFNAGSRLSARIQSCTGSRMCYVNVGLLGGAGMSPPWPVFTRADGIGLNVNSSSTIGTSHTPGNNNNWSAWATIATAPRDYGAVLFTVHGNLSSTSVTGQAEQWQCGVNSLALGDFACNNDSTERFYGPLPGLPIYTMIASGSPLQVRGRGTTTGQVHDVGFWGLR